MIHHIQYDFNNTKMSTYYKYFKDWEWFVCVSFPYDECVDSKVNEAKFKVFNDFQSVYNTSFVPVKKANFKMYNQIRFIDSSGEEQVSFQDGSYSDQLKNHNDSLWFNKAKTFFEKPLNNRKTFNAGVTISKNTNKEEMVLIAPVTFKEAQKGYIAIILDWTIAWKLLEDHIYGKTGHSFVINHQGVVIAHPRYSMKDHVSFLDERFGKLSDIVKSSMLKNKSQSNDYVLDGVRYIMYHMPVLIGDEQYSIAATTPADECLEMANKIKINAQDNYNQTLSYISVGIISSVVIAMLIAFLLSRSINMPLTRVVQFSKKVSEGDLSEQLSINRNDEFGEMTDALNQMVTEQRKLIKLSNLRKLNTPIIEIDNAFNLTFANDSFCSTIHKSLDQCLAHKCYELIKTDFCGTPHCIGYKAIKEKRTIRNEIRASYGGKTDIPVLTTYIPIENKGDVSGAICFIVDQSDIYDIIDEVRRLTINLHDSSDEFARLSQKMTESAREVASYSEQSSFNIKQISNDGEEISSNIKNEALAIKEMSQSLGKITDFTQKAKEISLMANEKSKEITEKMEAMANTSEEIGKVIITIDEIADRTDLLALNAAIEAEGAGSAGKGFAVVADEVQKLAKQSSDATNAITRQIENVQKSTKNTQHNLQVINSTISELFAFNSDIAISVENLNAQVTDISSSVNHASQKASSIADIANQSSQMAIDIVTFSKESAAIAQKTNDASLQMSKMAANLLEIVNKFKL